MKILELLIIILLSFSMTGCVSYMELNELGIIDMIVIDKNNDNYIVTINMLIPNQDDLENKEVYTASNISIDECLNDFYLKTNKKISFTHLELMALTSNIKQQEYDEIINLFLNRVDARNTFSTIIVDEPSNIVDYKAKDINELININSEEYGLVSIKQFDSIIKDILEMNISYIPKISFKDSPSILGYQSVYSSNSDLSKEESLGFNFITNQIKQSKFNSNNMGFKIDTSNTIITVNKNEININITSTYQITSNNSNTQDEHKIQKIYEDEINNYINDFINKNQNNYFLSLIEKYQNNYYKKNQKINIKYNITFNSTRINNSNIKGGFHEY